MTSRRQTYPLVVAFMLCVAAAFAQSTPIADPTSVGMSAERLARIDPVLSRAVEDGDIVGVVAMVARHGSVVYLRAEGLADREAERPMELSTRFRMASMTKPITSVAVMMLFEEGAFLLTDPVSDYLPEFSNPYVLNSVEEDGAETHTLVPAERPITIHHLLTHTSGIAYPIFSGGVIGDLYDNAGLWDGLGIIDSTIEEGVRRIASVPLNHHPGDQFTYGLSIDVLGRLIEVVSGMSFADFLRVRMFEPLGMDDTAFHVDGDQAASFATPYEENDDGDMALLDSDPARSTWARYPFEGPGTYFSGGAGLSSTVHDYGRFCQALLNGRELDGARILSPRTVAFMTTNHIRDLPFGGESGARFGLGFHLAGPQSSTHGIASEGTYGWGGYYGTTFSIDPAEDMFLIVLTQTQSAGAGRFNGGLFPNLVYQAIVAD